MIKNDEDPQMKIIPNIRVLLFEAIALFAAMDVNDHRGSRFFLTDFPWFSVLSYRLLLSCGVGVANIQTATSYDSAPTIAAVTAEESI